MDKHEQTNSTAQDNIYQPRPPQGTSDIARGVGLLIQENIETNSRGKLKINRNKV